VPRVLNLREVKSNRRLYAYLVLYRFQRMQVKSGEQLDAPTWNTVFFDVPYSLVEIYIPYKLQPLSSMMKMEAVGSSETSSHLYQTARHHFPYASAAVVTAIRTSSHAATS
jgi:hypothetical protein